MISMTNNSAQFQIQNTQSKPTFSAFKQPKLRDFGEEAGFIIEKSLPGLKEFAALPENKLFNFFIKKSPAGGEQVQLEVKRAGLKKLFSTPVISTQELSISSSFDLLAKRLGELKNSLIRQENLNSK